MILIVPMGRSYLKIHVQMYFKEQNICQVPEVRRENLRPLPPQNYDNNCKPSIPVLYKKREICF